MVLFYFGDCVYILLQAFKNTVYIALVYLAPIKKKKKGER